LKKEVDFATRLVLNCPIMPNFTGDISKAERIANRIVSNNTFIEKYKNYYSSGYESGYESSHANNICSPSFFVNPENLSTLTIQTSHRTGMSMIYPTTLGVMNIHRFCKYFGLKPRSDSLQIDAIRYYIESNPGNMIRTYFDNTFLESIFYYDESFDTCNIIYLLDSIDFNRFIYRIQPLENFDGSYKIDVFYYSKFHTICDMYFDKKRGLLFFRFHMENLLNSFCGKHFYCLSW